MRAKLILLLLGCFAGLAAFAQRDQVNHHSPELGLTESIVVLPSDYQADKKYPLLVLMPYTGGSSIDFFNKYLKEAGISELSYEGQFAAFLDIFKSQYGQDKSFILMLTKGVGSTAHHNFSGFNRCIEQYERRLERDFKKFFAKYSIDPKQVFMAGVSLGGDLSWAFSVKRPEWLKGAMVCASRCSYPTQDSVLRQLAGKNYSFFMVMGMNESADRLSGISYAKNLVSKAGIHHSYREMPYLEHDRAPLWLFMEGLHFLIFENHNSLKTSFSDKDYDRLCQDYTAALDIKKYQLDQEDNIHLDGDGLWLLQSETHQESVKLSFYRKEDKQLYLSIQQPEFERLELLVLLSRNEKNELCLQIPAQNIKNYVYKGISADINSLAHGLFIHGQADNFLSLDIEKYQINKVGQRSHFSFFCLFK